MEEIKNGEIKSLVDATPKEVAEAIAEVLDNKKAKNVKVLAVADKTVIADYFVIANGNTSTHVRSLADEVEYRMGLVGLQPARAEGLHGSSWRVIDYSSVIVHIFDQEARDFYKLEKLWSEAEEIDISAVLPKDDE